MHRTIRRSTIAMAGLTCAALGDTVTFREARNDYAGTVDTFIAQGFSNNTNGTSTRFEWDSDDPSGSGNDNVGLLRFDALFGTATEQIPPGAQITQATLTYSVLNAGDSGNLHEALIDWDESATWNNFGTTPGVQPNEYGPFLTSVSGSSGSRSIDVTASLARWSADPSSNFGWIILPTGSDGVELRASDGTPRRDRPTLTVIFNEGPPVPRLIRQPYLQRGSDTAITIAWRTSLPTDAVINYGTNLDQLDQTISTASTNTNHAIQLTGLTPDTTYYYEVGTSSGPLQGNDIDHTFDTAPVPGTNRRFLTWIVGDSGTGGTNQANVRDAMLDYTAGDPIDLFVHVGDMAYNSGTDDEFTENFFAPYADVLRRTVCWPTIGNHEADTSDSPTQSGPYYEAYMLPTLGEAGGLASGTEAYYSFDYANVHFICLDSHDTNRAPQGPMLTWLTNDLLATQQEWIIAYWHHPPYSKGTHDSDNLSDSGGRMRDMRANVLPILEAGGVDLVLSGHSHIYERSYLVDGAYDTPTTAAGHIVDGNDGNPDSDGPYNKPAGLTPNNGAVYVVAGHGGRSVGRAGTHPLMASIDVNYGSCLVEVEGRRLSLVNLRASGVITDHLQIIKVSPGDLDADGIIDLTDLATFLADFGCTGSECPGDANGDGNADLADLEIILENFGS